MADMNWSDMRKNATTILEGEFSIVFAKAEAGESQNGKPMVKCQLKIEGGPSAGRMIFHNFIVSPESQFAMKRFFEDLETLGLDEAYFAKQPSMEQIASDLLGKGATVVLRKGKEYRGTSREEVAEWKSVTSAGSPVGLGSMTPQALPVATPLAVTVSGATPPPSDPF